MPAVSHAAPPLAAAAIAYLAAQGSRRFGFGLVLPAMRDGLSMRQFPAAITRACTELVGRAVA